MCLYHRKTAVECFYFFWTYFRKKIEYHWSEILEISLVSTSGIWKKKIHRKIRITNLAQFPVPSIPTCVISALTSVPLSKIVTLELVVSLLYTSRTVFMSRKKPPKIWRNASVFTPCKSVELIAKRRNPARICIMHERDSLSDTLWRERESYLRSSILMQYFYLGFFDAV